MEDALNLPLGERAKLGPIPKPLSAVIGCKVRGSALSANKVLDVPQYVSEPFLPPALITNLSLDLATKQVLGWILVDQLLSSLDTPDEKIDNIWRKEISDRLAAYRSSQSETVSTDKVFKK